MGRGVAWGRAFKTLRGLDGRARERPRMDLQRVEKSPTPCYALVWRGGRGAATDSWRRAEAADGTGGIGRGVLAFKL